MAFFDLSIPYVEKGGDGKPGSHRSRESRLRTVARAMELGYTGIAYDSPARGVLSDSHICHISPFSFNSFIEPMDGGSFAALTATITFHRDLLGVPRDSAFRQYSRITISVDSTVAAAVLNSRNRLLGSYDVVAVRPVNQMAFDQACQSSEVDIIALDLSQKLPFRLKLPMVQSAIKHGLHFEICYSHLIANGHARRQILSDAKLLGDWTRGKNLIISSAATSLNEVRGPLDVANLATVFLGITMERAKAAVSGNCRSLLANALRKKDCYFKEAIKVERFLPDEQLDSREDWFKEWTDWDPLSSGEGDLPSPDDMAKLFTEASKHSKIQNVIDFTSFVNGMAPGALNFSKSDKHKHNSADGIHSCHEFEQYSNLSCVSPANMTLSAEPLPTTADEEKPHSDGNETAMDASKNSFSPSLNGFQPTGNIKPSNASMKDVELAGQLGSVSASMETNKRAAEWLHCSSVGSKDHISAVKIMNAPLGHANLKQFLGKNVEKEKKDEALSARTTNVLSTDMDTNSHPDMLIEAQEQSRAPCLTSTSVDPSKMEQQEKLVAPCEATPSKDARQLRMKLGKHRASAAAPEATKVSLVGRLKVNKTHTSSQFLKRTKSKKQPTAVEEEHCLLPENESSTKVVVKAVGNLELPVTARGHLRKSGKYRRKGRQHHRPCALTFKNICKPMIFKRTASRLRR